MVGKSLKSPWILHKLACMNPVLDIYQNSYHDLLCYLTGMLNFLKIYIFSSRFLKEIQGSVSLFMNHFMVIFL